MSSLSLWLYESADGTDSTTLLKHILQQAYNLPAETTIISRTDNGKPVLDNHPDISLNLSHNQNTYLAATGKCVTLGVDVENTQRGNDINAVAQRFFHPDEIQQLDKTSDEKQRRDLFFYLWTLKESYIKALGQTIGGTSLDKIPFSITNDSITANFDTGNSDYCDLYWQFHSLKINELIISVALATQTQELNQNLIVFQSDNLKEWQEMPIKMLLGGG